MNTENYYKESIRRVINKLITKYELPKTVTEEMNSKLSKKLKSSNNNIRDSLIVDGIEIDYDCYGSFNTGLGLKIEIQDNDYHTAMYYSILHCGEYVGSALYHFYFEKYNSYLVSEAKMNYLTNTVPCEIADKEDIDAIILLKRLGLLTTMFDKNDKSLPDKLKLLQNEFIRNVLIKNGVFECSYVDENGIVVEESGSTIQDDVYTCIIKKIDFDGKISFYIDKEFKAHLKLENDKKNNLTFNDIPQDISGIVMEKIIKAKELGADISDIKLKFRQAQQEAKEQLTNGTTVVGSGYGDR